MPNEINQGDLRFFTNEPNASLLDRFKTMLQSNTQYFDVLVGYFRVSGFYPLQEALAPIDKIRILVGLNLDRAGYEAIQQSEKTASLHFNSTKQVLDNYSQALQTEVEAIEEGERELELGLNTLINFLQSPSPCSAQNARFGNGKKLEIRAYRYGHLHAKIYIGRFGENDRDYGFVVTGSSNFSHSGLLGNREFNVELRSPLDVKFAEKQFEALWADSVEVSDAFVETIRQKTWLKDNISPYELYLKLIYEYLEEDINLDQGFEPDLPEGFMRLEYQIQAATQAKKILERHNGVFLADVVGLGKTFITALLLQQVQGRILVICPPVLKAYWRESLSDFGVRRFEVESLGKLQELINRADYGRYSYIVVDEAHRFRNENTQSYAALHQICKGKKVILVTATPINNRIEDLSAQLKLFQASRNSTIPGQRNLEAYFEGLRKELAQVENRHSPAYKACIRAISQKIRHQILSQVMLRRTRTDIMTYFKEDMAKQNLRFPDLEEPQRIVYSYEGQMELVFEQTMAMLQQFSYARYTPSLYVKAEDNKDSEFVKQQQRNVGGFMKGLLVKRMESSHYAFRQSLTRFISSYERFIQMYEKGDIYISKKVDVYDFIAKDNEQELNDLVEQDRVHRYPKADFKPEFIEKLKLDLDILKSLQEAWRRLDIDPKLEKFLQHLRESAVLKQAKLVIFTESKETGDYLYQQLKLHYPEEVLCYSSQGGIYKGKTLNHQTAREMIKANFDPKAKSLTQPLRILVTTDVLAEGINLHRANVLVNYDLPWNPTRVLQRVGRVNRLGSAFDKVYIFNFFPSSQSDEHLGLENNIMNKIQMFHDMLGEDAKYLSDGEEIGSQELFNTLNSKTTYTGELQGEDTELPYLELLRHIRSQDPQLFERLKKLPKKARAGFQKQAHEAQRLITFFRLGYLKKFYRCTQGQAEEISFFEAVRELACEADTPALPKPADFYDYLEANRQAFKLELEQVEQEAEEGDLDKLSKKILNRLKTKTFRSFKGFTESNEDFLEQAKAHLEEGRLPNTSLKQIQKALSQTEDPLTILHVLEKHIKVSTEEAKSQIATVLTKREIILSGYRF